MYMNTYLYCMSLRKMKMYYGFPIKNTTSVIIHNTVSDTGVVRMYPSEGGDIRLFITLVPKVLCYLINFDLIKF